MDERENGTGSGAATPYQFQKEYEGEFISVKFIVQIKSRETALKALNEFSQKSRTCYLEIAEDINNKRRKRANIR